MLLSATVVASGEKSVQDVAGDDCPNYYDHMREIEVRELKAELDNVLREVEGGETVRVTSDGRPVAEMVPMETADQRWKRMVDEGKITPASGTLPKDPPPPRKTGRSASAIILAEREEDR